jgi:hypothetical protein
MDPYLLAVLTRERHDELRTAYAHGPFALPAMRPLLGRVLRASGDRLFRWGVALELAR